MKRLAKNVVRAMWRSLLKPIVRKLPPSIGDRIETLLHYTKLTLVGGQTISFRELERRLTEEESVLERTADNVSVTVSPLTHRNPPALLPEWALVDLQELAEIEPSLYPTKDYVASFQRYELPMKPAAGELYAECFPVARDLDPYVIILVPWLKHGGADQGVLHHTEAAVAAGKAVLVIATLDADSPWADRLPQGAVFLPFGQMARSLPWEEQMAVLTRILIQSSAKTIHLINSPLGWDVLRHHGKSLRTLGKRIFASVFCDDFDQYGVRWSYADLYFPSCLPYLDGIFCDTEAYPDELKKRFGISADKLHTLYFPHALDAHSHYRAGAGRTVLWAGRFSRQKRVDLLLEIALAMPDVQFDVHGCGSSQEERNLADRLTTLGNVTVHGPFRSLDHLIEDGKYAAFLYTSAWDGLPIVLLDATAAGLPIVASSVGGVAEFITPETGALIEQDDVQGYVRGLNCFIEDPRKSRICWEQAEKLLRSRHTSEQFRSAIAAIPGYM
ncbi:glycosyltransferase family 4 protein [Cupriavidus sp. MP-37]|uniref:glycosyltransferase family 4 protein n=1 Tax=Cupriavidus sp. MP-37 TaxID=2884455 RepID=UPI001D0A674F|nr:glycosyltransferase family 4 protein [Cupriavidus sp. MP-37]UDM51232.1 glycosyltransferase family 4 protein [Cupriavidus sp. MP-37]